jgi:cysteine desulfurase
LSPVLEAMGIAPEIGIGAIRFSLGRDTALAEVEHVVGELADLLAGERARGTDARWAMPST